MNLSSLGLMESEQDAFREGGICSGWQLPEVSNSYLFLDARRWTGAATAEIARSGFAVLRDTGHTYRCGAVVVPRGDLSDPLGINRLFLPLS